MTGTITTPTQVRQRTDPQSCQAGSSSPVPVVDATSGTAVRRAEQNPQVHLSRLQQGRGFLRTGTVTHVVPAGFPQLPVTPRPDSPPSLLCQHDHCVLLTPPQAPAPLAAGRLLTHLFHCSWGRGGLPAFDTDFSVSHLSPLSHPETPPWAGSLKLRALQNYVELS